MNKNKIYVLLINLFLLVFLSVGFVYAWFINYGSNKIEGTEITVVADNMIEISLDNVNYSNTIKKNDYQLKGLVMTDVTGDGINLYRPTLNQTTSNISNDASNEIKVSYAEVNETQSWADAISTKECDDNGTNYSNAQYVSFDLYFKSNIKMNIYLTSDSYVSPLSETSDYSLYSAPDDADGTSNKFSKNWIAAASRVSFINMNDEENPTLQYVWAPNSKVSLEYSIKDNIFNGYILNTNSVVDKNVYEYWHKDSEGNFIKTECNSNDSYLLFTDIKTNNQNQDTDEIFVTQLLENNTDGIKEYTGKVRVNVWIEGTDKEARRALAGGQIIFNLCFTGFEVN